MCKLVQHLCKAISGPLEQCVPALARLPQHSDTETTIILNMTLMNGRWDDQVKEGMGKGAGMAGAEKASKQASKNGDPA